MDLILRTREKSETGSQMVFRLIMNRRTGLAPTKRQCTKIQVDASKQQRGSCKPDSETGRE